MARFVVPVALAAIGIWILREGIEDDDDDEAEKAGGLLTACGFAVIGLGLGISVDELAIGFAISFTRFPVTEVVTAIALQAAVAIWAAPTWAPASPARVPSASGGDLSAWPG
jgi:putative Mn2+ efflux pump MntP